MDIFKDENFPSNDAAYSKNEILLHPSQRIRTHNKQEWSKKRAKMTDGPPPAPLKTKMAASVRVPTGKWRELCAVSQAVRWALVGDFLSCLLIG